MIIYEIDDIYKRYRLLDKVMRENMPFVYSERI